MTNSIVHKLKSIAVVLTMAMFFSCTNDPKEVRDFLIDKNLPIGEAYNVNMKHTDSGLIDIKMKAPIMLDFKNRKKHPYTEFPKGLKITSIDKKGDSTTIEGDFARSYEKTKISEILNNVIIINYSEKKKLMTSQIYWDQNTQYYFTEKRFTFYTATDTIHGVGFEASENLKHYWIKNQSGVIEIKE